MASTTTVATIRASFGVVFGTHKVGATGAAFTRFDGYPDIVNEIASFQCGAIYL
jgi:hypothetical protein